MIAVCLTITLGMALGVGSSVASADQPPDYTWNWQFSYNGWTGTPTPYYTQSITDPPFWTAYRWWPAPWQSTSSTYFRLLPSLDQYGSTWKDSIRWAAGRWSEQDPMFDFYELPPSGNNYDRGIGMAYLPGEAIGKTYITIYVNLVNRKATLSSYYMRFDADTPWTDGTTPSNCFDRGSIALHELGHALGLNDVWGDWGLVYWRPTMHWEGPPGNVDMQSLQAGDIYGIQHLYW